MAKKATLENASDLSALADRRAGKPPASAPAPTTVKSIKEKPVKEEKKKTVQISAHIPKPLHTRVKIALARQDERLSLTELIIELLDKWEKTKR